MHDRLSHVRRRLLARPRTQPDVAAIELGLLIALIAVLIVGGVSLLGPHLPSLLVGAASPPR